MEIKKLLIKLLEFVESEEGKNVIITDQLGLCNCVDVMLENDILTVYEGESICDYIQENTPKKLLFWGWTPGDYEPRVEWLKSEISKFN